MANLTIMAGLRWGLISLGILVLLAGTYFLVLSYNSDPSPENPTESLVGQAFPEVCGETLAGTPTCLPQDVKGKPAALHVAFKRCAQEELDPWNGAMLKLLDEHPEAFHLYEVPMLAGGWKVASGWIDGGMRSGIPQGFHDNVLTYYGPLEDYHEQFNATEGCAAYVFILDDEGVVRFQHQGPLTDDALAEAKAVLLQEQ